MPASLNLVILRAPCILLLRKLIYGPVAQLHSLDRSERPPSRLLSFVSWFDFFFLGFVACVLFIVCLEFGGVL